jgi:hypothetical protein
VGRPFILYGVEELTDHSFEDDAPTTDPPVAWDDSLSVNGQNEVTADEANSPGVGFPSVQSVRQNVDSGAGGNKAIIRQRTAAADVLAFLQEYGNGELAGVAVLKGADSTALTNAVISIEQYDGGTSTPGSGSLKTPSSSRNVSAAGSDNWELRIAAEEIHADADWVDVLLTYDIALGGYGASSHAYWDRVYVGAVFDLADKGFRTLSDRVRTGFALNEGDKVVEVVRYTAARTEIDVELRNVLLDQGAIDADAKRFMAWHASSYVGRIVLWVDRDRYSNSDHHFVNAYPDDRVRIRMPRGVERRRYNLRFNANGEIP